MAYGKTLILERWDTPCADFDFYHLVFEGLTEKESGLMFSVRHEKEVYDFKFEDFGPYQVADEAFLQAYQADMSDGYQMQKAGVSPVGSTAMVINSDWEKSFNLNLMYGLYFLSTLTYYHISTADSCLDILAATPPTISVRTKE